MSIGIPITRRDEERSEVAHIYASTFNQTPMTTTERRLAITPGTWTAQNILGHTRSGDCPKVVGPDGEVIVQLGGGELDEVEANAELIADAGTVTNETGMTPRELLAKLTKCAWELEKARQELVSCKHYLPPQSMEIVDDRITRIELFRSTLTLPADEHK